MTFWATLLSSQATSRTLTQLAPITFLLLIVRQTVLAQIKSGDITGTPTKVIYVGHSMGSGVGTMLAATYADSIDKLVLTGNTTNPTNAFVIAANTGASIPAKDADPARFGDLLPGYVTQS